MSGTGLHGRNWVLATMTFAVAMTFIDQTIVVMAFAGVVALFGLERGRQEEPSFAVEEPARTATGAA